jgi:hypothetical protein
MEPAALVGIIVIAGLVAALGFGLGMLVAPRIERWAGRDDEESGDDGPG